MICYFAWGPETFKLIIVSGLLVMITSRREELVRVILVGLFKSWWRFTFFTILFNVEFSWKRSSLKFPNAKMGLFLKIIALKISDIYSNESTKAWVCQYTNPTMMDGCLRYWMEIQISSTCACSGTLVFSNVTSSTTLA